MGAITFHLSQQRSGHARGGAAAAVVRAAPPRNFENAELDDGASWARRRGGGGVDDEASRPVDGRAAALPGLAPAGGGRGLPRPTTSVARCRTRGTGTSKNDGRWTYENPRILSFGDEKYFSFQIQGFRIVSYGVSLLIANETQLKFLSLSCRSELMPRKRQKYVSQKSCNAWFHAEYWTLHGLLNAWNSWKSAAACLRRIANCSVISSFNSELKYKTCKKTAEKSWNNSISEGYRTFAVVVLIKFEKNLLKKKELSLIYLTIIFWLALQLLRASRHWDASPFFVLRLWISGVVVTRRTFLFLRCEFLVASTCVPLLSETLLLSKTAVIFDKNCWQCAVTLGESWNICQND